MKDVIRKRTEPRAWSRRYRLCLGTALTLTVIVASRPVSAQTNACSSTAPASGATVTCNGSSRAGVIAATSTNVTVNVQPNANVTITTAGQAINLSSDAKIIVGTNSVVDNTGTPSSNNNNYAIRIGRGATVTVNGKVQGRGGITGAGTDSSTNFNGFVNARIIINQGGEVVTTGLGSLAALNGRAGGNTYTINGIVRDLNQGGGILAGPGDVITIGASGKIISMTGNSANPISGLNMDNVTVTTMTGSLIELHGLGRGIQLGNNANVALGGLIRSYGDMYPNANSAGGMGVSVGGGSTVRLLAGAQIITGNTQGLSNRGAGANGIMTFRNGLSPGSTVQIDGLIDTQLASGLFSGIGDTITIGTTGRVTARGMVNHPGIFANLQPTATNNTINITIEGVIETLGAGRGIFLSGNNIGGGQPNDVTAFANVTIAPGGRLFAQSNAAYGQDDGAGSYPEIVDNLIVAGTVARGTPGTVIDLNDGADRITFLPTYALTGNVDGGSDPAGAAEIDTFALDGGAGTSATFNFAANQILNFEAGEKLGAGTWILTGDTTGLNGTFAVKQGTLIVNGVMSNTGVIVASDAVLGGTGTLGAALVDGTIAPGSSVGTLTLGSLALSAGSALRYELGIPGLIGGSANDLINVTGNLTLDGSLDIIALPGFGEGIYRLINYGGTLTDNGLAVRNAPDFDYAVQTGVAGQVNLIASSSAVQFWDGADAAADGVVDGGTGNWTATRTNWTNRLGNRNRNWAGNFAVFQGAPGIVTIDPAAGGISASGLQFAVDGYTVAGGPLTLTGTGQRAVRVGDGTTAGVSFRAAVAAALTGASGLDKQDFGTLILTGTNSYSGGTRVSAGTLQIGNGGTTGSVVGDIRNDAMLVFNRSDDVDFDGVVSGTGSLTKAGTGLLRLRAAHRYTGATTVAAGTLWVDGAIASSPLTVAAGATLTGTGTVGGATIAGTIGPGGSAAGTLTVAGNYAQQANSTYLWGPGDLVRVTGTAMISGGRVRAANAASGLQLGERTAILTAAGGRSGAGFAGLDLVNPLTQPFLDLALTYDANNVFLQVVRNRTSFASAGATINQRAAASGIDRLTAPNPLYVAISNIDDVAAARQGFDAASGEIQATLKGVLLEETGYVREAVSHRLAQAPEGAGLWVEAIGSRGHSDGDGNAATLNRSAAGFLFGIDSGLGGNWRAGIAMGYSRTNLRVDARASRAEADTIHLGVFAGGRWGATKLRAGAAFAWHDLATWRAIGFSGYDDATRAKYGGLGLQAFAEVVHRIPIGMGGAGIEPFAALAHARLRTGGFAEWGGAAALRGERQADRASWSTFGLRGDARVAGDVLVYGSAAWQRVLDGQIPTARIAFGAGTPFTVLGTPLGRDSTALAAGVRIDMGRRALLGIGYSGAVGSSTSNHGARATVAFRF